MCGFFINRNYDGCPQDAGWMVITEKHHSLPLEDVLQEDERHTVQHASGFYKLEQEK